MKKLLMVCLSIVFIFISTACQKVEEGSQRDIYVPVLADGAWLKADGAFINGVQLAVEDLNSKYGNRGFKVKTAIIDDKGLYETGVEMATKLAADNRVTGVFNLQDFDVSKTTAEILAENKKLTMFPYGAFDSLFTKDNPYLYSGVPAFADLGKAMANYAVQKGYKRIAIFHNGTQSQEELVAAFEVATLNTETKVVDYVPTIASRNELDAIYSRWQALGVDCVVISQYGLDRSYEILQMLRSKDSKLAVIGEPIFNSADALAKNKEIAEGMAVPSTLVLEESPGLKDFRKRYRDKYKKEADIWAVQGYDLMSLIVDKAVKLDTNNPTIIAQALHETKGYQGIGRHLAFAKGGAMLVDIRRLPMLENKGGQFK